MREGERDDTACLRSRPPRVGAGMDASIGPPAEPVHQPGSGPLACRAFRLMEAIGAGDPDGAEAETFRLLFQLVGQGHLALD